MQDEHRVDVLVVEQRGDRCEVVAHGGADPEVDRVAEAVGARQRGRQALARRLAGRGEAQAARHAGVGRDHAEAAGVRHHADAAPAGQRLALEQRRRVEQGLGRLHPQDAGLTEQGIARDLVQGAAATALDREQRLAPRHAPRDLREAPGVAEGLHVERDGRRALVVLEVLEDVVGRDVGAVAQRHERRDAEAARGRVAEQRQPEGARL